MAHGDYRLKICFIAILSLLLSLTVFLAWGCGESGTGVQEERGIEERDEGVIEEDTLDDGVEEEAEEGTEEGSMPFSTENQSIGFPTDGLKIAAVRYADHGSYYRLVFELSDMDGTQATVCPSTTAQWLPSAGGVKVVINGIRGMDTPPFASDSIDIDDSLVQSLDGLVVHDDQAVGYVIALNREAGFYLHLLTDPMRIIVDVDKLAP